MMYCKRKREKAAFLFVYLLDCFLSFKITHNPETAALNILSYSLPFGSRHTWSTLSIPLIFFFFLYPEKKIYWVKGIL